ncbi:MAG TPA: 7TM domain-containing protein [Gemmataceae bacterium]|nr:7TM domain-containing protein [Gemmataceae bacterium]
MSRTGLTFVTAFVLAALSVALMLDRWYVLGKEIDGTPGTGTWKVTVEVEGELLAAKDPSVTTVLPPDFRHQHVIDETFASRELSHEIRTAKDGGQRKAVWLPRLGAKRPQPFHLTYTFRCVTGMHRPTPGMVQRTRILDAAPTARGTGSRRRRTTQERLQVLRPSPLIESDHPDIEDLADRLVGDTKDTRARTRALFDHVAGLDAGQADDALDTLREKGGSAAGRARLLVALCRNERIPARPVSGLVVSEGTPALHTWAEAWVENYWLPMDPARHQFGAARFPDNYLVLQLGDNPVGGTGARVRVTRFTVTDLHESLAGGGPPSPARRFWRKLSLANLRPEEQVWVKFLLLLPVAALVVCVFRTVVGITTFGTFGPALLGLVCRDVHDFPWALGLFVGIMLTGWLIRKVLDRYHLLMVPRISVLLTCIVSLLVLALALLGPEAGATRGYVALLPLIILTHMVERFWTVETEDGTGASFKTLLGTVVVAVAVTFVVNFDLPVNGLAHLFGRGNVITPDWMRTQLFRYPEGLLLPLAGQLVIGRYTGYRLTELFRFRDLLWEEKSPGGPHEPAGENPAAEGNGRAGDEPAQHGVHPGPEPEGAVPPGGR